MAKDFMTGLKSVTAQLPNSTFSELEKIKKEIVVVEELRQFITPLSSDELSNLESNILKQGCKDPLAIWETTQKVLDANSDNPEKVVYVLIDGHNRYSICQKYAIDFKIVLLQFESIEQVKDYMIDYQLGRRNLTPEQMSYFRGLRYNREKGIQGKYDRTEKEGDFSEILATEFKVSPRTIKNDGNFAAGIAKLAPELQQQVLAGNINTSRSHIQNLGRDETIESGTLTSLNPFKENETDLVKVSDESINRKKEIAKLVISISTKSDYLALVQKVKELKKFI
ncbi:hypothetical protein LV89_04542 [Arcicella aurantiaca]|uniref:ParB-like nuclease family protein n=1 Tax=Arcicella aurantiaca TaxID=591202 RepID=A0A316DFV5_9BACT|nr:hypothetical protein [Arcicella aurantiaca]PWK17091.1 hypothetical protein LV89_04542 [Arcicella aurantiaca]